MWKTIYFLAIYTVVYSACAQQPTSNSLRNTSGRWLVSAQTGNLLIVKSTNAVNDDFFQRTITPSLGYFVTENLVIGLGIPVWTASKKGTYYSSGTVGQVGVYPTEIVHKQIGIQPYVQKYFGSGKLKPFVGAAYNYLYQTLTYHIPSVSVDISQKGTQSEFSLSTGLTYFLASKLGLDVSLQYAWQSGNHPYVTFPNQLESGAYSATYAYNHQHFSVNTGLRFIVGK